MDLKPQLVMHGNRKTLFVDGKPFVMLGGECHNSSSSSARVFAEALDKAVSLGMNSVLAPVTWELIEPEEGRFDFSSLDLMLSLARERGIRLGLLWFGAWKNAQCYYAPAWVKRDTERFRRAQMVPGQNKVRYKEFHNFPYTALSLFCDATREADARAFSAVMAHLAKVDATEHTVVLMQVENEVGEMVAGREHSPWADAAFAEDVPTGLIEAIKADPTGVAPELLAALEAGTGTGSWSDVFGEHADEMFTTYHMASYVEAIAQAGRAAYDIPLVANCWLDKGHKPGRFPTGGPNARVMAVWKYAAPTIDAVGPDIYVPTFCQNCNDYTRPDNPLFIPETATHAYAAAREIWAVAHHRAICFAPFAYEEMGEPFGNNAGILFGMDTSDPALRTPQNTEEYAAATRALAQLIQAAYDLGAIDSLDAVISERPDENMLDFGDVRLAVNFSEGSLPGACAAFRTEDGDIYLLAMRCMLEFESLDEALPHLDADVFEDGAFVDGVWQRDRRLNGDEVALITCDVPVLLRFRPLLFA